MMKLKNTEAGCLFLHLFGPQRAATVQRAMYVTRHGKLPPRGSNHNSEYFRPKHCTYGDGIPASRYVVTSDDRRNAKTALWCRDNRTMQWNLTERGRELAIALVTTLRDSADWVGWCREYCRILTTLATALDS